MKPRNIPIDIAQGTSKNVTIVSEDQPDLTVAEITLIIKMHAVDENIVLSKQINATASTDLSIGTFVFSFEPSDTATLVPRSYVYEIKIQIGSDVYIPLLGDFNIFNTITN